MAWMDWGIRLAIGVSAARHFDAYLFLALLLLLKQLLDLPEEGLKRNSSRSKPAGFGKSASSQDSSCCLLAHVSRSAAVMKPSITSNSGSSISSVSTGVMT